MPNYFYIDANGQKQGLINDQQLQALAAQGVITPNTPLETEGGHKGLAMQIPSLKFNTVAPHPSAQPARTLASARLFCTNCGNTIAEHAVACLACGAKPVGHKKFCRHCGVALNPEQVICIKCRAGIATVPNRSSGKFGISDVFAGFMGIHNFGIYPFDSTYASPTCPFCPFCKKWTLQPRILGKVALHRGGDRDLSS